MCFFFFFFNDTATTEIYTLSLHDALPIFLALGFLSMGVFEQFHAIAEQDNGAVFLRSVASLVGGIGFALVWLPLSEIKGIRKLRLPWLIAAGTLSFRLWTPAFSDQLPPMIRDRPFTA